MIYFVSIRHNLSLKLVRKRITTNKFSGLTSTAIYDHIANMLPNSNELARSSSVATSDDKAGACYVSH